MRNLFNMDSPLFRALGKLADLMILNVVFLLCCIPVFTIGAALTGLNYVTLKMAQDEESYIARSFFKSFKQNFKQATAIWLMALVIGIILILDLLILRESSGTMVTVIRIAVFVTIIIYAMVMLYVFPVLCRFENTVKGTIRNAFIIAIADLPKTILMLAISIGAVIITLFNNYTLVYGILIWLMFGFALVSFATSYFMKKILAKYMPKDEDEEKDPDSWDVDETMGAAPKEDAGEASEYLPDAGEVQNSLTDQSTAAETAAGQRDLTENPSSQDDAAENLPEQDSASENLLVQDRASENPPEQDSAAGNLPVQDRASENPPEQDSASKNPPEQDSAAENSAGNDAGEND